MKQKETTEQSISDLYKSIQIERPLAKSFYIGGTPSNEVRVVQSTIREPRTDYIYIPIVIN